MDPSIKLAKLYSSFEAKEPVYQAPKAYSKEIKLKANVTTTKEKVSIPEIEFSKSVLNNSIFMNQDALELANLDAVLNVTHSTFGLLGSILSKEVYDGQVPVFADLGGIPGGWVQYLQYRWQRCQGYGISLDNNKYDKSGIEFNGVNTFTLLEGLEDHSGDIITNFDSLYDRIHKYHPYGLNLVIANATTQSKDYYKYLIAQMLFGLKILSNKGVLILRVAEVFSSNILELIQLLTYAFEEFYLFKPFASGFDSSRYLVARVKRKDQTTMNILEKAFELIKKDKTIKTLIEKVNEEVETYVNEINLDVDKFEIEYDEKNYNLVRLYYYWDIPSYSERKIYKRF